MVTLARALPSIPFRKVLERRQPVIKRETVLIVDDGAYWYASLPESELAELDDSARYIGASKAALWWGSALGGLMGFIVIGALIQALLGFAQFSVIMGFMFGGPTGVLGGWWIADSRFKERALWVVRRKESGRGNRYFEPVIPRELLDHYTADNKPFVMRSHMLTGVRDQQAMQNLFARRNKAAQRLQMFAMIVLMGAIAGFLFLMFLVNQDSINNAAPGG